jgi:hypothetical protein
MTEPVSEERQKAYFDRAHKGVLAWLANPSEVGRDPW